MKFTFDKCAFLQGFFCFYFNKNDAETSAKSSRKKVKILFVIDVSVIIFKISTLFLLIKSTLKTKLLLVALIYLRSLDIKRFILRAPSL